MPRRNYRQITTGKQVKGVTTHLSVLSKPALLWWAYKQGFDNFERLMSDVSKFNVARSWEGVEKLIKTFQVLQLYEKRDKAADAGTLAHLFIENHLKGLPEPSSEDLPADILQKAEGCFLTFLDWEKQNIKRVIGSEIELTSELYPFGGTIDHVIITPNTPSGAVEILDIKTGKDIYFEARVQVKAYQNLYEEHHPEQKVTGFHILRLGQEGEFTHKFWPSLDERYYQIFLNCLNIGVAMEQLGEKL